MSGGDVLIGPGAGPVRSQVGAAGPDDRGGLAVNAHALEPGPRAGLREHRSVHALEDVDLASEPVGEG